MIENNEEILNLGDVKDITIAKEIKTSFLSYAMSVIVSRALPDVRDGLKPVHRRILYGMHDLGMFSDRPYKKSARIVGEVIGKYHPHGDTSIYDAMVRMAQDFSCRYLLVDGHGNFGSVDGDGAAAMRYTEARMSKIAMELLKDIDKDTVDFIDNYDGSEQEPSVFPSRFPNLLANGVTGIAVGMATNIPPHNLGELIEGINMYIDDNDISVDSLLQVVKGPDFPTGGIIMGIDELKKAYETGKGSITIRSKTTIKEHANGKKSIIVSEIPFQVNKTQLIEKIAELVKNKKIEGIVDIRDESNRKGMKLILELKRDSNESVILNKLYKYSNLQVAFNYNMIALTNGVPKLFDLKGIFKEYVSHQINVLERKTAYELKKAEEKLHILEGLLKALNNIDEVVEIVKTSQSPEEARNRLTSAYALTEIQARAILDMRLQKLTGLEIDKIQEEHDLLVDKVADLKDILASESRQLNIVRDDLNTLKDRFGSARKSEINYSSNINLENEDLIPKEDSIITITKHGWTKRSEIEEYKTQNRGGMGVAGMKMKNDDYIEHLLYANSHDQLLVFTNIGRVYKLKGYEIPKVGRNSKGTPIVNLIQFKEKEQIAAIAKIDDFEAEDRFLFFVTENGLIKRTKVNEYQNIRQSGIQAFNLKDGDNLIEVRQTDGTYSVLLGASSGKAIRFAETRLKSKGRTAGGIIGIRLNDGDKLVGAAISNDELCDVLVVTENGYGKRTCIDEYKLQTIGGKGIQSYDLTDKNGKLIGLRSVTEEEDVMLITNKGATIRVSSDSISRSRRLTQGAKIMRLKDKHNVTTIAVIPRQDEDIKEEETQSA